MRISFTGKDSKALIVQLKVLENDGLVLLTPLSPAPNEPQAGPMAAFDVALTTAYSTPVTRAGLDAIVGLLLAWKLMPNVKLDIKRQSGKTFSLSATVTKKQLTMQLRAKGVQIVVLVKPHGQKF